MSQVQRLPREIEMLQQAAAWLAECQDLDEIKKLHDKAESLRLYFAKQKHGEAAVQTATRIVLQAQRRIGEISRELEKSNPGSRKKDLAVNMTTKSETLMGSGISPRMANRCEAIAALPAGDFEQAMQSTAKQTSHAMQMMGRVEQRKARQMRQAEPQTAVFGAGPKRDLGWEVITGHCGEVFDSVEFVPIDLVFADPPYGIGVDYGEHFDDVMDSVDYLNSSQLWIKRVFERLTPDGTFMLLSGWQYAHQLAVMGMEFGLHLRQTIIWYESFGVNCTGKYNRCSRALLWFTKHKTKFAWHPEKVSRDSDRQAKYNDKRANPGGKTWDDVWGINPPIPRLAGTHAERIPEFPTQLPLDLLRPIVAAHSNPGDLVVDPFCGSGTTGVASIELGRRFVGIELSEKFAEISRNRLSKIPYPGDAS